MKAACILVCFGLAACASTGVAGDGEGPAVKPAVSVNSKESPIVLTGSYIKRTVKRYGRITDGPDRVFVIDRETIERSGASDLKQLLVMQGLHR